MVTCFLFSINLIDAQEVFKKKHMEVTLRMIGHQVLLNANDSTSRVLPIVNDGSQYRVEFESKFGFIPGELVQTIGQVMDQTKTARRYIVEVEACDSKEIVYSFEKNNQTHKDIIACSSRNQQIGCYNLVFTFLDTQAFTVKSENKLESNMDLMVPIGIGVVVVFGLGLIVLVNYKKSSKNENVIELGKYRFDLRNALLILKEQKVELTGKEADLLQLLHASVNAPVKRDTILNKVWGDEGNYIGRTLDVYISKLRNKLQADPTIKIVNIRGVGYKLVIDS